MNKKWIMDEINKEPKFHKFSKHKKPFTNNFWDKMFSKVPKDWVPKDFDKGKPPKDPPFNYFHSACFPLIFLAWDYYNTGSFIHSCITCCRDFAWPAAVVVA